jgi:hypothetical protein
VLASTSTLALPRFRTAFCSMLTQQGSERCVLSSANRRLAQFRIMAERRYRRLSTAVRYELSRSPKGWMLLRLFKLAEDSGFPEQAEVFRSVLNHEAGAEVLPESKRQEAAHEVDQPEPILGTRSHSGRDARYWRTGWYVLHREKTSTTRRTNSGFTIWRRLFRYSEIHPRSFYRR